MKRFFIYLATFFLVTGMLSCSKRDISPELTSVKSSLLNTLPFSSVILEEENSSETLFTISWSKTEFYLDGNDQAAAAGPVNYTVEVARANTNFEQPVVLASTAELSATIETASFNNLLKSQFQAQSSSPLSLEFRVITRYGLNSAKTILSGNTIFLNATVFEASDVMQPVYLVGDMNGWNNTNTDYILFRDGNDGNNRIYTYTGWLGAGIYFKFLPQESLGTFKMYCRSNETQLEYATLEGGAFYNENEGFYTITLNLNDMTYTIVPYTGSTSKTYSKIGPIGEFTNWDNEPAMTKTSYDPHQWHGTFTFNSSTTCKFRGDNNWANNWGGSAGDIPWGLAIFDGPGAAVPAGTYRIYFNDLTGRYAILKQ